MTDPLAQLKILDSPAGPTVTIVGEIDASNIEPIAARLDDLADNAGELTIDLTAVSYLDSQGVRVLQGLADRHVRNELALTLVVEPTSVIYRLLTITGLNQTVPLARPGDHFAPRDAI